MPFRAIALVASLGLAALLLAAPAVAVDPVNTTLFGVAIEGFDPAAYFSEGRPVEGSKKFSTRWMGANWRFASAENSDRFVAEPERFAVVPVESEADARALGPLREVLDRVLVEVHLPPRRWQGEPTEELAARHATRQQVEQGQEGLRHARAPERAAIRDAVGYGLRLVFDHAKDCLDVRGDLVDVRRHHDDVLGQQRRVGLEGVAQRRLECPQHVDLGIGGVSASAADITEEIADLGYRGLYGGEPIGTRQQLERFIRALARMKMNYWKADYVRDKEVLLGSMPLAARYCLPPLRKTAYIAFAPTCELRILQLTEN